MSQLGVKFKYQKFNKNLKANTKEVKSDLLLLLKATFCYPHRLLGKPLQADYKSFDCQLCSQPASPPPPHTGTCTHTHTSQYFPNTDSLHRMFLGVVPKGF